MSRSPFALQYHCSMRPPSAAKERVRHRRAQPVRQRRTADTPNVMSVVTAQFIEWMDIDVVPVLPAEETVAAEAAGGLVELS